ncbi:sensor histidine kinase [Nonomuraea sp. WAC 01424]|uniref:sensor histidine kinase n=1 Tax=Nonomuraea sp. WAC 01424 TaxID=2203200 RepID=UPI000F77BE49|nr:histidine kinase [Nonomuraea sp. WAC 01424]
MNVLWVVAASLPASVAVVVAAVGSFLPRRRDRLLPALTLAAAGLSLAVTAGLLASGVRPGAAGGAVGVLGMAESAGLMVAIGLVVRHAPVRRAVPAALLAGLAAAAWVPRVFTPASPLETVGAGAFWGLGALLAAAVGAYLRLLDVRRERAVADTRTVLRLRLAGDLHDFLAHDISEMVAHAQAGTVAGDPLEALRRVEAAGQRALSTLDRTLDMLHHDRPPGPAGDLAGIAEAAERFSAAGPARVRLRTGPTVAVPAETAALAYRIVIEGLTNIRRHAPRARRIDLSVTTPGGVLEITLANDGVSGAPRRRRGGSGLPSLAALVAGQGGELVAHAVPDGWSLAARLPLPQSPG